MSRYIKLFLFVLILLIGLFVLFHHYKSLTPTSPAPAEKIAQQTPKEEKKLLDIHHWTTSNGAKIFFVPTPGIPIIDVAVTFDAGSARDADKEGLASLCINLLSQGTSTLTADQIAEKFDDTGALYTVNIGRDRAIVSLRSLIETRDLNSVMNLFSEVFSTPAFSELSIQNIKNRTLSMIEKGLQEPKVVSMKALYKAIYNKHPYAHTMLGTKETVASITQSDLIEFHKRYFVAKNAVITIVGGIAEDRAKALAENLASKLQSGSPAPTLPEVTPLSNAIDLTIPFPSEQAHILMGQPLAIEGDPDFFPLLLGNYILGGNRMNSRLFKNIRADRGLVYHVRSEMSQLWKPAPFVIQLQTQRNQTKEALHLVQETLNHFIQMGPTEAELIDAKQGIMSALLLNINSNAKILETVSTIGFYKLPLNFLDTYQQEVSKVTAEHIKSVFQKRVHPEKMVLTVVGNPS